MKLWVYAICKNELCEIDEFVQSILGSDEVQGLLVVDTGSTDGSYERLCELATNEPRLIIHQAYIIPWRFDTARNIALSLVPAEVDWLISVDLDQRISKESFQALRTLISEDGSLTRISYNICNANSLGAVFCTWVHRRFGYHWKGCVHNYLVYTGLAAEKQKFCAEFKVIHYQKKSAERSMRIVGHKQNVKDEPLSSRPWFYLGREHWYLQQFIEAKEALLKYLSLGPMLKAEKAEAMRILATIEKDPNIKKEWLLKAGIECPARRDHWCDLAQVAYETQDYSLGLFAVEKALLVDDQTGGGFYSNGRYFGSMPYNLGSIFYHRLGVKEKALQYIQEALKLDPKNAGLLNNLELMRR